LTASASAKMSFPHSDYSVCFGATVL
jgi:hypothetical protein